MTEKKTLTFALMDPPFESARVTTAMRLMSIAAKRGYNLNIFAYEGAVFLPLNSQKAHPNAVHGHDAEQEAHPLSKDWVASLMKTAEASGAKFDWVNCGLCVDERGAEPAIQNIRRGTPQDLLKFSEESDNTVVIPTR